MAVERPSTPASQESAKSAKSGQSGHCTASGRFRNPWPGARPHGFRDFLRWTLLERGKRQQQALTILPEFPLATPNFPTPRAAADEIVVTWIGHSSFLLQIGGRNVLLDPIWSDRASPVTFAGPKRVVRPGIRFEDLPPIDLVLLSHDHYDHLDASTVRRILAEHAAAEWIAPLGVGKWLVRRGAKVIAELDWWQSVRTHGLEITCTPAQHFSGRKPNNRNSTLWCGWVIRAGDHAVFFAGDTGLHPEFGDITRQLGPFDAAFIPIGAYEPRWFMQPVHLAPEEAVSAYSDIVAENHGRPCTFVAMHCGTFKLTDEPLDEPPRLTRAAWAARGYDAALLWIPQHGESRVLSRVL